MNEPFSTGKFVARGRMAPLERNLAYNAAGINIYALFAYSGNP
jgi:hypothetical protein